MRRSARAPLRQHRVDRPATVWAGAGSGGAAEECGSFGHADEPVGVSPEAPGALTARAGIAVVANPQTHVVAFACRPRRRCGLRGGLCRPAFAIDSWASARSKALAAARRSVADFVRCRDQSSNSITTSGPRDAAARSCHRAVYARWAVSQSGVPRSTTLAVPRRGRPASRSVTGLGSRKLRHHVDWSGFCGRTTRRSSCLAYCTGSEYSRPVLRP